MSASKKTNEKFVHENFLYILCLGGFNLHLIGLRQHLGIYVYALCNMQGEGLGGVLDALTRIYFQFKQVYLCLHAKITI